MKNLIRDVFSKPIIWYLRYKRWDKINIIINVDGSHIRKRDFIEEEKSKESIKRWQDLLDSCKRNE